MGKKKGESLRSALAIFQASSIVTEQIRQEKSESAESVIIDNTWN